MSTVTFEEADEDDFLAEAQHTSKFLQGFNRDELRVLASSFSIMRISSGEAVVEQGETGLWAGLLISGELTISINGEQIPGVISAGQFVGEMAVFANGRRAATISCSVGGRIATMLIRDLHTLLEKRPTIGGKLVTAFARSVMETLIFYRIPRWEPSSSTELKLCEGSRVQLDEWMDYLRANEPGFASIQSSSALNCFQVLSFAEGARLVKRGSGVFQGLAVVLDGRVECSWPSGRVVEKYGLIGEHSLILDDWSLRMPSVTAMSAGSIAVLSEAAFARLRADEPLFHAALIYLMAAEAVHQLTVVGQQQEAGDVKRTKRQTGIAPGFEDGARDGGNLGVLYKAKMVAGLKLEAAAAGELAKDSAAKLERTAHTLRRYKVLALKYERERDSLAARIEEMEGEMKRVKNLRRELSNARADCQVLQDELAAARTDAEESNSDYLRERFKQQAADAAAWKQTALSEHAARESERARFQKELASAKRAHTRAAELEAQVVALCRAREEQASLSRAREGAARELTKRNAMLEAQACEASEAYERAQKLLGEREDALRACEEERRELAERLRTVAEQRRTTIVRQSVRMAAERRASQAFGVLGASGGRAEPGSATADAAREGTIDELTRINGELAEALQEQSAALWAAKRRLALQADRGVKTSIDTRESLR